MQCLIIDDEKHAVDILTGHIERTPELSLSFGTTDASKGLAHLRSNPVDLLFLDIEMPEITGIEVLKLLSEFPTSEVPHIILTTGYSEYAVQSYEYNVVDYIMKPVSYQRFLKALNKLDNLFEIKNKVSEAPDEDDYILVKTGVKGKMLKIVLNDIQYVEGLKNYVSISYSGGKIPVLYNLSDMEEKLSSTQFMRIHRSFILNLKSIQGIEGNEVVLPDGKRLPIGLSYKDTFFKYLDDKILRK
ncbi:MAG: LytTR family DNA-binding domain-containing protein [Bacteroidota bacterium]